MKPAPRVIYSLTLFAVGLVAGIYLIAPHLLPRYRLVETKLLPWRIDTWTGRTWSLSLASGKWTEFEVAPLEPSPTSDIEDSGDMPSAPPGLPAPAHAATTTNRYRWTRKSLVDQLIERYPAYADWDRDILFEQLLEKYPVYRAQIDPATLGPESQTD